MIVEIEPSGYGEWDEYVSNHPSSTCYHLSGWAKAAAPYRLRVAMLGSRARPAAGLRGALPLFVVPRPFHRYVTTGLFGAYGPLVADDEETAAELVRAARRFTDAERAQYLHFKWLGDGTAPVGLTRLDVWQTAMLPLSGGADAVWRRFKSSIRAAVRQARRAELELRSGHDQLDAFYGVLCANMHRKGAPPYGIEFMRAILGMHSPAANVDVLTLWRGREPISGALTIAYRGVMYVPFASSLARYFQLRPNNLLYWHIIERACAQGMHTLDFGTSLKGASTFDFKLHWGAAPHSAPSYLYWTNGTPPRLDPTGLGVRAGVQLLRRLPRALADALGPVICRYMA